MKKSMQVIILVAMLLVVLTASAMAAPSKGQINALQKKVEHANATIEGYVHDAQATPWDDVDEMQKKIEKTVNQVKKFADNAGLKVECEYEDYFIDGRWVSVDPLRVVNIN